MQDSCYSFANQVNLNLRMFKGQINNSQLFEALIIEYVRHFVKKWFPRKRTFVLMQDVQFYINETEVVL